MSLHAVGAALLAMAGAVGSGEPAQDAETRGQAVLERAVALLGGRERLAGIASWYVEGQGRENLSAEAQGLAPDRPTWRPHQERLAVDARALAVAWQRRTPRNDFSLRWRRLIYRSDASGFVDHVAGVGVLRPAPAPEPRRRGLARRVPHLLLLEAATRAARVAWQGERRIAGRAHDMVRLELPDEAPLSLTLGREPALLRRVEYETHVPALGKTKIAWEWRDWRRDEALGFVPSGHGVEIGGTPFQEVVYSRYAAPSPEVGALLEVPRELQGPVGSSQAAAAPPASAPPLPATGEVAPGVHVAEIGGFVVMAVEFRDFVAAFEAPEPHPGLETIPATRSAAQVSQDYLAWIRKSVPGKPVRYVVVSHHHSDHLGGLPAFAAAGATVLVSPGHRPAATRALEGATATVEAVSRRRVLTDGVRRVEVLNVGRNPHTDDSLAVWLPNDGIVFQGDLFYYSEGQAFPPSGRQTMNRFFAEWLRRAGIEPRAVYGVHNEGAATPAHLAQSLQARPALDGR